jgi:hypothetical protein
MGGGSKKTEVTIPQWLEDAARQNIARANATAQIGYTPYYGPDVAALTPMQIASMQGTNTAASAFGLPTADPMAGMPTAQNYGGMMAYSSGDMYDQALAELQRRAPGQYDALRAPFIDPITGAPPAAPYGGMPTQDASQPANQATTAPTANSQRGDFGRDGRPAMSGGNRPSGGGTGSFGLPDPMSGKISSVGPIGRDGGGMGGRK